MSLVLTSLGAITALGYNVETTCASLRAGVARPTPLMGYRVLDPEVQLTEPVVGFPIVAYTEGYHAQGRWVRLARAAFADVCRYGDLPGDEGFWGRTILVVVTPVGFGPRFQADGDDEASTQRLLEEVVLEPLFDTARRPRFVREVLLQRDHSGMADGLTMAHSWVMSGEADRALIVCVDSYLDPLSIEWLMLEERLRTPLNPTGATPGEAAVALLVEREEVARQRGASPLAHVAGIAVRQEFRRRYQSEETNTGAGLAHAWADALAQAQAIPFVGDLVVDHTGEAWRARELGSAYARLGDCLGNVDVHMPAASVGEIGAASGALGACLLARAWARGYATASHGTVLSSAPDGRVAAYCLARPGALSSDLSR